MIEIDLPKAVELVLACIAEKPEGFKYRDYPEVANGGAGCVNLFVQYDEHDVAVGFKPACLIGSALVKAGMDPQYMYLNDAHYGQIGRVLCGLNEDLMVSDAARQYFAEVQDGQDSCRTWAKSHTLGLEHMLKYGYCWANDSELAWLTQA